MQLSAMKSGTPINQSNTVPSVPTASLSEVISKIRDVKVRDGDCLHPQSYLEIGRIVRDWADRTRRGEMKRLHEATANFDVSRTTLYDCVKLSELWEERPDEWDEFLQEEPQIGVLVRVIHNPEKLAEVIIRLKNPAQQREDLRRTLTPPLMANHPRQLSKAIDRLNDASKTIREYATASTNERLRREAMEFLSQIPTQIELRT